MYLPRRHYRRLLLPPGWVALGFLLLLGCQALVSQLIRRQIECITQLTMPILEKVAKEKYSDLSPYCFCKPLADIKTTTRWQNAQLIGNSLRFPVNKTALEAAVQATQADAGHARGVRVFFRPTATYGSLVSLLDMMNRLNQRKYWLDIEHRPVTFYIVNDKAVKTRRTPETNLTYY
ncbi:MAG: hypothetical protein EOO37_04270 [Cytophagaceae bacterium]|nr:MAG: hypothetical protein EOO37_04270 [Cytophagaceae bacterium]